MAVRCVRTLTVCNHSRGSTWWGSIHATHSITHYIRDWFYVPYIHLHGFSQISSFLFSRWLTANNNNRVEKKRTVWLSAGVDARPTEKATSFIKQQQKKRAFYPNMVMKEITHTTPLQRHTHYRHTNNTQTLAHTKRSSSGNSCRTSFFL